MMKVVKMITDDDGEKYANKYWHYFTSLGDGDRVFCDGHVFGIGKGAAEFETKEGKITCPRCINQIKIIKAIKL